MKLKLIILNETSQTKESIYCRILLTWNSRKFKLIYHDRKQIGCYLGVGRWGGVGGRSNKSAEETCESNKYFSLSWLCWVVLWVLYMCMSKLIKLHILNMCSLFYFEFLTVIEWMNEWSCSLAHRKASILSFQCWNLPKVLWLPQE